MKSVSKKLLAAIAQLGGSVPKTGWNNYSKYHYVTEADINNAVLPALLKQGLLLTTSVETVKEEVSTAEQKNRFASVVLLHKIIDTESGEVLEFKSTGTGADTLDKAVYKAYTGACKYFLMKLFLLSGDSDPENDGVTPPQDKPAQGLAKPGLSKPAPAQAAPAAKPAQQGFLAKKTTEAAPAQTGAKKPSFGAKKPEAAPVEQPAEAEAPAQEEDAAY
jgi:hypothetical protein